MCNEPEYMQLFRNEVTAGLFTKSEACFLLDFETNGFIKGKQCQKYPTLIDVGCLNIDDFSSYSSLIDSNVPITDEVQKLTGINTAMITSEGKHVSIVLKEFVQFLTGKSGTSHIYLVAHNTSFF